MEQEKATYTIRLSDNDIDSIIKALLKLKKEKEQCSCYKFGKSSNSGMKCSNCGREL